MALIVVAVILVVLVVSLWLIARLHLAGEDLAAFDMPRYAPVRDAVSPEHVAVATRVREMIGGAAKLPARERLQHMREAMDAVGDQADLTDIEIRPTNAAGVPAEWILPRERRSHDRLLYIHGGAFTMGSPQSHRPLTTELARRTGLAILAIDYRLMPEHPRAAGIDDCRTAWQYLSLHGPEGPDPAGCRFVAGDSAGGNLTLALVAWLRDQHASGADARPADGAIALSPLTDATFASPSVRANIEQDVMLGPMAALLARVPRTVLLWMNWLQNRRRPNDPVLSPVRGELAGLPPILVQASEAEILVDDARRYVNRARHAGSPVELETWHGMVHVWQIFGSELPEADEAYDRMAAFIERARSVSETRAASNAA